MKNSKKPLETLLEKEVTRKQFLLILGAGAAGLFGLSSILGMLTKETPKTSQNPGYGKQNYGP